MTIPPLSRVLLAIITLCLIAGSTLAFIPSNEIIHEVNTDSYAKLVLSEFEGDTFRVVTDEREVYLKVENGLLAETDSVFWPDYTVSVHESTVTKLWMQHEMNGWIDARTVISSVNMPWSLRLKISWINARHALGL